MRFARTLAAFLLPLALIGACGDDDAASEGAGSSTTSSAPASPDASGGEDADPAADRAADQALADAVVLRLEDLGPGWSRAADDEDEDDAEDDAESDQALADCLQVDLDVVADDEDDVSATASFEQEQGQVDGDVDIVPTVDEAVQDFAIVGGDRFADCFGSLLDEELRKDAAADEEAQDAGVTYGGVEMERLDLPAGLGDQAAGYRATISISANGVPFQSFADFLFVRRGRLEMTVSLFATFEAPPVAYAVSLASIMDERAAAA